MGLNPCCNGRGSKTTVLVGLTSHMGQSLNPCCNGRGSKTEPSFEHLFVYNEVLILVVMEEGQRPYQGPRPFLWDCLNPCCNGRGSKTFLWDLRPTWGKSSLNPCCNGRGSKTRDHSCGTYVPHGLNPCCNGRGSKTQEYVKSFKSVSVLILVVMEEGQRLDSNVPT